DGEAHAMFMYPIRRGITMLSWYGFGVELTGKRVLITGASSGIGASLARELKDQGAKLILAARRVDELQKLADELGSATAEVRPADLGTPAGAGGPGRGAGAGGVVGDKPRGGPGGQAWEGGRGAPGGRLCPGEGARPRPP